MQPALRSPANPPQSSQLVAAAISHNINTQYPCEFKSPEKMLGAAAPTCPLLAPCQRGPFHKPRGRTTVVRPAGQVVLPPDILQMRLPPGLLQRLPLPLHSVLNNVDW